MKKGDIIWIRRGDCVFCSEINNIEPYSKGFAGFPYKCVNLIPIIGDCIHLTIYDDSLLAIENKKCTTATALFESDKRVYTHFVNIALDVNSLF